MMDADAREQMQTEHKKKRKSKKKKKEHLQSICGAQQWTYCVAVTRGSPSETVGLFCERRSHASRRANHARPYSPCRLKILVIVSCTYCCNFAPLKLKLPWRESKQTASVSHQEID